MCRNRRTAHGVCLLLKSGSYFSADPNLVRPEPEIALPASTYQKPWHLSRVPKAIALQEGVEDRMELVVADQCVFPVAEFDLAMNALG